MEVDGGSTSRFLDLRSRDGEDLGGAGQEGDEDILELHIEFEISKCLEELEAGYNTREIVMRCDFERVAMRRGKRGV